MARHDEHRPDRERGYRGENRNEGRGRHEDDRSQSDRWYFGEDQADWNPRGDERWIAKPGMRGKHEMSHFGREPGRYDNGDSGEGAIPQSRERAFGGRSEEDGQARRGRGSYDPDYYYPEDARERRTRDQDYYAAGRNDHRTMTFDRGNDEVSAWLTGRDQIERRQTDANHRGRGPRNYTRSDDRIREDINDRLSDDPDIDASDIEVTVSTGEVTLDGKVTERFAKRHAEDIAESVSGVTHVQNNLRIASSSASGEAGR